MNMVILSPVRIFGDALSRYFDGMEGFDVSAICNDCSAARDALLQVQVDVLLVDVGQMTDFGDIRDLAASHPETAIVAIGLQEQRQNVIRCGRAGFVGYAARESSAECLVKTIRDALAGRLACSEDISGSLLRALFRTAPPQDDRAPLTHRENDVLRLIGRGLTNKEIARELGLSLSTVKHHVHNVLGKMQLSRRAHAMRAYRQQPWM